MLNGHKPLRAFFLHQQFSAAIRPSACRFPSFLGFYSLRVLAASTMKSDSWNLFFLKSPFCLWKTDVRAKQTPCAPESTDANDMRRIYVHDDDRVLLKVQNLPTIQKNNLRHLLSLLNPTFFDNPTPWQCLRKQPFSDDFIVASWLTPTIIWYNFLLWVAPGCALWSPVVRWHRNRWSWRVAVQASMVNNKAPNRARNEWPKLKFLKTRHPERELLGIYIITVAIIPHLKPQMLFKPTQSREGGFDSTGLVGQDLVHGSTSTRLQYAQKIISFTHGVKYSTINSTKYKKRILWHCDKKKLHILLYQLRSRHFSFTFEFGTYFDINRCSMCVFRFIKYIDNLLISI